MKRRTFIAAALAAPFVPSMAQAAGFRTYKPGLVQDALKSGKTVLVDYSATWCGTCKRQGRVINALRDANPAYDKAMMFVKVDWDDYKNHSVTTSRGIPRRSTLIVLKGNQELGRIVAGTGEKQIKELMDLGL